MAMIHPVLPLNFTYDSKFRGFINDERGEIIILKYTRKLLHPVNKSKCKYKKI